MADNSTSLRLNVPAEDGVALGAQLARLTEGEAPRFYKAHAEGRARCATCAFRAGTYPNGCAATLMDALKCVLEGVPFHCHEAEEKLCAGYVILRHASGEPLGVPWKFSDET